MGIFDNCLICSDYDNTLTYHGAMPPENLRAIHYFRKEGGKFVVVTGRTAETALKFDDELKSDGYVITNNGNVLFGINQNMPIHTVTIKGNCIEILKRISEIDHGHITQYGIYFPEESIYFKKGTSEFRENEYINKSNITKMSFDCDTEEQALRIMEEVSKLYGDRLICTRAWPRSFEICDAAGGKGAMVKELKKRLKIKTLICVGDYENDVDMLKEADISFAPSDCAEKVRMAADKIIESGEQGIFSEIIGILKEVVTE